MRRRPLPKPQTDHEKTNIPCPDPFLHHTPRSPNSQDLRAQFEAIRQEKANRTPAELKIESRLLQLAREAAGKPAVEGVPSLHSRVDRKANGTVTVDISATPSPELSAAIIAVGGTVVYESPRWNSVRANLPPAALVGLAASPGVTRIRLGSQPTAHTGSVTSQGDKAHRADVARTDFGVDGTGVKVGVISDSADHSPNAITQGDLPADFTVLPGRFGTGSGEGTAMSEIVHDLAPGAKIFFASANGGKAAFGDAIVELRAAGCDIIVDDISYSK